MTADSAAAAIEFETRSELMRLLLEPKLGAVDSKAPLGGLDWKSYHWGMQTVWLTQRVRRRAEALASSLLRKL